MPERSSYQHGEPSWIDLGTPDLDASIDFYTGMFGWEPQRGGEDVGGYTIFTVGGRPVAGAGPLMTPGQRTAWSSYVNVDDADAVAALAQKHGGSVLVPPMDVIDVGRMAVLVDPVEAVIAVWQARQHIGASIQGDEGTFAWTELTTRDPDTALPFYEAVFGWKANREPGYTEFELDGRSVAGCMEMPASVPADVPSSWMPYFAAADPQGKASQAEKLGATVLVPFTEVANVAFTVVADPQQARFGLLHLTQH